MYYIVSSRPYSNSKPPIHTLIDPLYADVINRYQKSISKNTSLFSAGTDEHGLKMYRTSLENDLTPQEYVDRRWHEFYDAYRQFEIKPDIFGRTATPKHHWLSNLVWDKLKEKNLIYKKSYQGLYCSGCEDFYAESQLVNGRCPIHQHLEIEQINEDNYFFRLSHFKSEILDFLNQVYVPDSSIIEEMKNITEDIQDISISRPFSRLPWGVPVNSDPDHVMYVWFEALLSYLSCLIPDTMWKQLTVENDRDKIQLLENQIWQEVASFLPIDLMVMGRDNSKFHLIILPSILLGLDLPLPNKALIHGMLVDKEGKKFSKSLGNGITTEEVVNTFGIEGLRFFVLFYCNSVGDTSFDWNRLIDTYNSQLADNIGNLVNRITTLTEKYLTEELNLNHYTNQNIIDLDQVYKLLDATFPEKAFQQLLFEFSKVNAYLEQNKPWNIAKDPAKSAQLVDIISTSCLLLAELGEVLSIFLPTTGKYITEKIGSFPITKSRVLFPKII